MKAYIVATLMLALIIGGCLAPGCPDADDPVCGSDGKTYKNACFAQQAGVQDVEAGPCGVSSECSDSDGGKDIFTIGQAVDDSGTYDDSCADKLKVDEMHCEAGEAKVKAIPCPTGYECLAGACVETRCSDSDGGSDANERGTVSAGEETETDSCLDPNTVNEYYCDQGGIASRDIDCGTEQECRDGACVESTCEDDDAKDTSVKGTTTKGAASQSDSCVDSFTVREYFCQDGSIENENIDCQSGYECLAGKCVESICMDSDGGQDQYTKGTTSYGDESHTDSCYSSSSVIEYYCVSDSAMNYEKINCGTGHECIIGVCEPIDCEKETTLIDEINVEYEIVEYGTSEQLTLYAGDVVQLNNGLMLKAQSMIGTDVILRLYLNHEDLIDSDIECTVTMAQGDTDTDLCGEDTEDIEIVLVDDTDNYVELVLEEYYVMEYYDLGGRIDDWTDDPSCSEDREFYNNQMIAFFPYADTDSSGLDLEGRDFVMFGEEVELEDIGTDSITFILDGEEYDLEDGDKFDYRGEEYEIELSFDDTRLQRIEIDLD